MKAFTQIEARTIFKRLDFNFAFVIFALNLIGLINLYSATHGVHVTNDHRFWMQVAWLFAGWSIFFATTLIDYKLFYRLCYFLYVLNLGALVAVMFVGSSFYGAQRWLDFGFFRFQPSETMKLCMILVLSRALSQKDVGQKGLGYKDLFYPLLIMVVPFALIVKQPDLGTALLLTAITASMLFFVKIKRSIVVMAALAALVATPLIWNFGLKEYQQTRIISFLSPNKDPRGTGYNSIQAKIAVGSGRILGKGFRQGTQSQLEFLPERSTDFIFSVLSEEHGFIGSITTLGLFVVLYLMGLRIAAQARDKFGALITVGVLCYLFWHMFVNMGMVVGLLPIVGVPLPLLSYGGSSLITTMAGLGLISSVAYRRYLF